jgi:2-dehydro-3-deoxygluconokinase
VRVSHDLIALGETMVALAPSPGETLQQARVLHLDHAGAESNTCVGLARMGFRVAWVSRLGQDPLGARILQSLEADRVDTRWVIRDAARPTGVMIKDPVAAKPRYYRTGSAASALSPADLEGVPVALARAVLVTGVTPLLGEDPGAAARAFFHAARGLRVFDPNLREGLWGSSRRGELVRPLLEACDLLLGGEEELAEIVGDAPGPEGLARLCAERGPREVVVRGARTLGALADGAFTVLGTSREDAVDPIGAGDAFNAGYLSVRLRGGTVGEALATGARCGRAVALELGDTAGFPCETSETPAETGKAAR